MARSEEALMRRAQKRGITLEEQRTQDMERTKKRKLAIEANRGKTRNPTTTERSPFERIWAAAHCSRYFQSVRIVTNNKASDGSAEGTDNEFSSLEIITSPSLTTTPSITPSGSGACGTIVVKPLIILDVNGVLCHRKRDALPITSYRPIIASIGSTPIIPRPDLESFLDFLDEHFCVAIWSSAKCKTTRTLTRYLIPQRIRRRLLFVWAQNKCDSIPNDGSVIPMEKYKPMIFQKDIQKVWTEYPLWNSQNTVFVDDSPHKSATATMKMNVVHPQSLNGRAQQVDPKETFVSDEDNVVAQRLFFEKLVQHFQDHGSRIRVARNELEPKEDQSDVSENALHSFLSANSPCSVASK